MTYFPRDMEHNPFLDRYSRHLALPDFGLEDQEKLQKSRVLVVGCGGLGVPVLQYLAAAGIGTLGLVDDDNIELSNLQRQVLYNTEDIGKSKAITAAEKLSKLNPDVHFFTYNYRINSQNALVIVNDYDIVVDGTDNFPTRYLLNDACVLLNKTLIYGSIFQYEGQVSVFNASDMDGNSGPNYRDLFPSPPPPEMIPNCAEGGVLGVLPGIIGSIQALEVIKLLTGIGDTLNGKLLLFDAKNLLSRIIQINKNPDNPISGLNPTIHSLIDYEAFCGMKDTQNQMAISAETLSKWKEENKDFQLIDVRSKLERLTKNIGGEHMPMSKIDRYVDQIRRDVPVVIYCRSGMRSASVIKHLKENYKFDNLLNLTGGIIGASK